jgi:hypothetical protein
MINNLDKIVIILFVETARSGAPFGMQPQASIQASRDKTRVPQYLAVAKPSCTEEWIMFSRENIPCSVERRNKRDSGYHVNPRGAIESSTQLCKITTFGALMHWYIICVRGRIRLL